MGSRVGGRVRGGEGRGGERRENITHKLTAMCDVQTRENMLA